MSALPQPLAEDVATTFVTELPGNRTEIAGVLGNEAIQQQLAEVELEGLCVESGPLKDIALPEPLLVPEQQQDSLLLWGQPLGFTPLSGLAGVDLALESLDLCQQLPVVNREGSFLAAQLLDLLTLSEPAGEEAGELGDPVHERSRSGGVGPRTIADSASSDPCASERPLDRLLATFSSNQVRQIASVMLALGAMNRGEVTL